MPETITIPISFFEAVFEFEKTNVEVWATRAAIAQIILDALQPWAAKVDDLEPVTTGKASEHGLIARLPLKRVALFFGPSYCRFSRDAVGWDLAKETIEIFEVAGNAYRKISGSTVKKTKTTIGVHLQPKTIPFIKLLSPFLAEQMKSLELGPLRTMAAVAKWENRIVTLDGSGSLANGIFVRLERDFEGDRTLHQIAEQLWKDEEQVFDMLGVKEDA